MQYQIEDYKQIMMNRRIIYALSKVADDPINGAANNTVQGVAPNVQNTSQSLLHRMGSTVPIGAGAGAATRYMDREKLLSAIRGGQAATSTAAGAYAIARHDRSGHSLPFERALPALREMWNAVGSLWGSSRKR